MPNIFVEMIRNQLKNVVESMYRKHPKSERKEKTMYLTVKQQAKHLLKEEYCILREIWAKNLTNEGIYNVRQYYFSEGEFLKYKKIILCWK